MKRSGFSSVSSANSVASDTPLPEDRSSTESIKESESFIGTSTKLNDDPTCASPEIDHFIDPRLRDYPIPLVAKTVDLHNDET